MEDKFGRVDGLREDHEIAELGRHLHGKEIQQKREVLHWEQKKIVMLGPDLRTEQRRKKGGL
jgi:hypothetical protein